MRPLILGSASPRRLELLHRLGLTDIRVTPADIDEACPEEIAPEDRSLYLARKKSQALLPLLREGGRLLLTADTIVLLDDRVLDKPRTKAEAKEHLRELSGRSHRVITGFVLTDGQECIEEKVTTMVTFAPLTEVMIDHYTTHCEVMDKAGAYGIQDWIGLAGVVRIDGSYTNVMGLPTAEVYRALTRWEA